jgi:hypothetical protein
MVAVLVLVEVEAVVAALEAVDEVEEVAEVVVMERRTAFFAGA